MSDHPFSHIYLNPDFGSNSPTDLAARQQAAERMERLNRRLALKRNEQRAKRKTPPQDQYPTPSPA